MVLYRFSRHTILHTLFSFFYFCFHTTRKRKSFVTWKSEIEVLILRKLEFTFKIFLNFCLWSWKCYATTQLGTLYLYYDFSHIFYFSTSSSSFYLKPAYQFLTFFKRRVCMYYKRWSFTPSLAHTNHTTVFFFELDLYRIYMYRSGGMVEKKRENYCTD